MSDANLPPNAHSPQVLHKLMLQESLGKSSASQVEELRSLMFRSDYAQPGIDIQRLSSLPLKPEPPPLTLVEAIRQMPPADLAKLFGPIELPEMRVAQKAAVPTGWARAFWPASSEPVSWYGSNKEEASELIRRGMFDPAPTRSTGSIQGFTGLMMLGSGIDLADAVVTKDGRKAVAVGTGIVGGEAYMAIALGTAGAASLPVAMAIGGSVGGFCDTYSAIKKHDTARAVKSGIEATLYGVAAWAGAAGVAGVWFPPLTVAAETVALAAGAAAVSMTATRMVLDHWDTVKGWFGKRGNDLAATHAQPSLPAPSHPKPGGLVA